jgi:AraC family transcriptional regulator
VLIRSANDLTDESARGDWRARWRRENCIVSLRTRHLDFGPLTHSLSIRCAWGGAEYCQLPERTVAVDDCNFLIVNDGRHYSTRIHSTEPVESLAICLHSEFVEQVCGAQSASMEHALDGTTKPRTPEFIECLYPHDRTVSPVLRFIKAHLARGVVDEAWYEDQLMFLLMRMLCHRDRVRADIERLDLVRRPTRREVYRRVALATDFLHTHYSQELDLSTLARIACLSKYHFLRLFTLVHGVTPRTYLQRKRTNVAARMLETTELTMSEIAASVGFGNDSTLLRQMRRWTSLTPRQVRTGGYKDSQSLPARTAIGV